MDTKNKERISALADGELAESELEMTLAALREPEGKALWEVYHAAGDVLSSEDMAIHMSTDFSARLMAKLESEPVVLAPAAVQKAGGGNAARRFALPGAAVALAAAVFFVAGGPQLMVASKGEAPGQRVEVGEAVQTAATAASSPMSDHAEVMANQQMEILRDPNIDEYLMAHQRFSPSVYSAAQYARAATFATKNDK